MCGPPTCLLCDLQVFSLVVSGTNNLALEKECDMPDSCPSRYTAQSNYASVPVSFLFGCTRFISLLQLLFIKRELMSVWQS